MGTPQDEEDQDPGIPGWNVAPGEHLGGWRNWLLLCLLPGTAFKNGVRVNCGEVKVGGNSFLGKRKRCSRTNSGRRSGYLTHSRETPPSPRGVSPSLSLLPRGHPAPGSAQLQAPSADTQSHYSPPGSMAQCSQLPPPRKRKTLLGFFSSLDPK